MQSLVMPAHLIFILYWEILWVGVMRWYLFLLSINLPMPIAEFWSRQRPDEAGAWFLLGSCRLALRLDATEALLKAWALDPGILDLPNNLGGAYLMKGDLVQAQHWLNLALERQADDENTLSNLALLDKLKKTVGRPRKLSRLTSGF